MALCAGTQSLAERDTSPTMSFSDCTANATFVAVPTLDEVPDR